MRKYKMVFLTILFFLFQIDNNVLGQSRRENVDFPWVPRVSAYEAYTKFKEGKAIILHAGGEKFNRRHIIGAFNFDVKPRDHLINKLPKQGIEIFTYCY